MTPDTERAQAEGARADDLDCVRKLAYAGSIARHGIYDSAAASEDAAAIQRVLGPAPSPAPDSIEEGQSRVDEFVVIDDKGATLGAFDGDCAVLLYAGGKRIGKPLALTDLTTRASAPPIEEPAEAARVCEFCKGLGVVDDADGEGTYYECDECDGTGREPAPTTTEEEEAPCGNPDCHDGWIWLDPAGASRDGCPVCKPMARAVEEAAEGNARVSGQPTVEGRTARCYCTGTVQYDMPEGPGHAPNCPYFRPASTEATEGGEG